MQHTSGLVISPDILQRHVDAIDGDRIGLTKVQMSEIIADLRAGQAARQTLAAHRAVAGVCDRIAGAGMARR